MPETYRCDECGEEFKFGDKVLISENAGKAFCCTTCAHMHLLDEETEFRAALKIVKDQTSASRAYLHKIGD